MGQNNSRDGSSHGRCQPSLQQQPSAQWGAGGGYYAQDPRAGYYGAPPPQQGGGYAAPYPAPAYQPTAAAAPAPQAAKPRQLDRRYSRIADDYHSVDQVRVRLLCHW